MNSDINDENALQANHAGLPAQIEFRVLTNAKRFPEPETILLVEGQAFVRNVTAEVLKSAGYRVLVARNAAEALKAVGESCRPVDLLLADVLLPRMNGCELSRKLGSLGAGLRCRVLLMSGHAEQLATERFHTEERYLAKPFTMQSLLREVREALDADPFIIIPSEIIPSEAGCAGLSPELRVG